MGFGFLGGCVYKGKSCFTYLLEHRERVSNNLDKRYLLVMSVLEQNRASKVFKLSRHGKIEAGEIRPFVGTHRKWFKAKKSCLFVQRVLKLWISLRQNTDSEMSNILRKQFGMFMDVESTEGC